MIYEMNMPVQPGQRDDRGRLKMSALLYFAQEIAGKHAANLGAGWDALQEKNLFWAVIRTRVEVEDTVCGDEITLKTWPMPTSRTAYPRCVMGYDGDRLLFKLVSLWVLMDTQTRAMVLPGKSGVEVIGTVMGNEPALPKGLPVTEQEQTVFKTVAAEHLDKNGHMNNTRYMDWVMECAPEKTVKGFELCYFNEGRLQDEMELGYTKTADMLCFNIHRQRTDDPSAKDRIFAAMVQF